MSGPDARSFPPGGVDGRPSGRLFFARGARDLSVREAAISGERAPHSDHYAVLFNPGPRLRPATIGPQYAVPRTSLSNGKYKPRRDLPAPPLSHALNPADRCGTICPLRQNRFRANRILPATPIMEWHWPAPPCRYPKTQILLSAQALPPPIRPHTGHLSCRRLMI